MEVKVPYGKTTRTVKLKCLNPEILYPRSFEIKNDFKTLKKALENPIDSPTFSDFIKDTEELLIIVNDATRPTPTSMILSEIFPSIKNKNLKFLIATGTHRAPREEEYEYIFGDLSSSIKEKIYVHDAKNFDKTTFYGTTKRGTNVYFNNLLDEAVKIIIINSVEPHYYAGFTGGRKSFLPGISFFDTIEKNHKFALSKDAISLKLSGNPVHEDMMDALETLSGKEIFSIHTVLDTEHRIYTVSAGNIKSSFENSVKSACEVFSVDIKEKADIVITAATYPLDLNMYQSHKALDNGKLALKKEGILILVAECRDGIGHNTFYEYLAEAKTPEEVLQKTSENYKLGCHISANIANIVSDNEIWVVTSLESKYLEKMFMKPCKDLQSAIDDALTKKKDPKIIFLMQGSVTVPNLINRK